MIINMGKRCKLFKKPSHNIMSSQTAKKSYKPAMTTIKKTDHQSLCISNKGTFCVLGHRYFLSLIYWHLPHFLKI